jgi:hypothetical protein
LLENNNNARERAQPSSQSFIPAAIATAAAETKAVNKTYAHLESA